ncbi:MAG TPA: toll/interleukin-1 receptor domain-containing protein [Kiritimatiellia bacterium]|nr:toll/interleukin-1 receptor domain-containing protein [Kiritimatiellia bacterium]HMP00575.1 toll/interleukin-1 receptor domain-containing protein [Kiritimatiellia bacterium]
MKNLITKELLAEAENKYIEAANESVLNEAFAAHTKRASLATELTVFLSHKHTDSLLVRQAVALFKSLGVEVYIDWLDSSMPPVTDIRTANRLKEKIRTCSKFVFLASDDAIASKWCNWELGLGDAAKYLNNIAILPAGSRGKSWSGSEYLGIYPVITSEYQYHPGTYYVEFGTTSTPLKQWLINR